MLWFAIRDRFAAGRGGVDISHQPGSSQTSRRNGTGDPLDSTRNVKADRSEREKGFDPLACVRFARTGRAQPWLTPCCRCCTTGDVIDGGYVQDSVFQFRPHRFRPKWGHLSIEPASPFSLLPIPTIDGYYSILSDHCYVFGLQIWAICPSDRSQMRD